MLWKYGQFLRSRAIHLTIVYIGDVDDGAGDGDILRPFPRFFLVFDCKHAVSLHEASFVVGR